MLAPAELRWWCSCQVWGTQISVRKLSDSWDNKTTNLKISTPQCPRYTYLYPSTIRVESYTMFIPPARAQSAGAMERESLVFLGIHFIQYIIFYPLHPWSTATSSISVILISPRWQAADAQMGWWCWFSWPLVCSKHAGNHLRPYSTWWLMRRDSSLCKNRSSKLSGQLCWMSMS